jgi:hypothetical protein
VATSKSMPYDLIDSISKKPKAHNRIEVDKALMKQGVYYERSTIIIWKTMYSWKWIEANTNGGRFWQEDFNKESMYVYINID